MKIISEYIIEDFKRNVRIITGILVVIAVGFSVLGVVNYSCFNASFSTVSNFDDDTLFPMYVVADILLQNFGSASYLLMFIFMMFGVKLIIGMKFNSFIKRFFASIFAVILLSSAIANVDGNSGIFGYVLNLFCIRNFTFIPQKFLFYIFLVSGLLMAVYALEFNIIFNFIRNIFLETKKANEVIKENFIPKIEKLKVMKSSHNDPMREKKKGYIFPPTSLFAAYEKKAKYTLNNSKLEELKQVLTDFGIKGQIVNIKVGPVVTLYEFEPAPGIKSSRVISLAGDIARSLSAVSVRIAVIPGRNVLGIEIPNQEREMVMIRELLESKTFKDFANPLGIILGKNIGGDPVVVDLSQMPHLLVAGTTGSGKSVAINTMILSILYKTSPDECKFIMVDPKMLELSVYEGIPHLLTPVVTDPKKAVAALKWAVREMERRYQAMSKLGVRNIQNYNEKVKENTEKGKELTREVQTGFDSNGNPIIEKEILKNDIFPYIVVIVDEMADLMLVAGKEIEIAIQRLAQMARAAGIHIIMATQRPSVDVITGTIKANFPTRISFHVTSKIDSRTVLGEQGAEQLLGKGDMLYMSTGGFITRVHGPFCSDDEVERVVSFLKAQGKPNYINDILVDSDDDADGVFDGAYNSGDEEDPLYNEALEVILKEGRASTSFIQRNLKIGYNRAARIVELMEKRGVLSPPDHIGRRKIL